MIKKGFGVLGWVVSTLLLLLFLLIVLINVPQVQNMLKDVGIKYLNKKLGTTVQLKHLAIRFPSTVSLDSLYVADRSNDTLIYSGHLFVKMDMLGLLSGNVHIDSVQLDHFSANIYRTLPDTVYNFDYIIKSFSSGETDTEKDTSSAGSFFIKSIGLSKIHLRYKDVLTGYDGEISIGKFHTHFDSLDLDKMRYALDSINLSDVQGSLVQQLPLKTEEKIAAVSKESNTSSSVPDITFAGLFLNNIRLKYISHADDMDGHIFLDSLLLLPGKMDLRRNQVHLKKFVMDSSELVFSMKSKPDTEAETDEHPDTSSSAPWLISLDSLQLVQNHFIFNDNAKPKLKKGIDYSHLNISDFILLASGLSYSEDSSYVTLKNLSFKEQSGFDLKHLSTHAVYTNHGASLDSLLLLTPGSRLSKKLAIRYSSLNALSDSIGEMGMAVNVDTAVIDMKDVYYFQPDLAQNEYISGLSSQPVFLHGVLQGRLNKLDIDSLFLKAADQTSLDLHGKIQNILNPDKATFDIGLKQFITGRKDIRALLPKEILPDNIRIPARFSATGNYKGSLNSFVTDLQFTSTDGSGKLNAVIRNLSDSIRAIYNVDLSLNKIRLDRVLKNDTLYGPVSMNVAIKGSGLTLKSMQSQLNGRITQAVYNGYNYKNLSLNGAMEKQIGHVKAEMADPNINFSLLSHADFSDTLPAVDLRLNLSHADLYALHLSEDSLDVQGKIDADITQLDIDKPEGKIIFNHWQMKDPRQAIYIDSVLLKATAADTGNMVIMRSPIANADILGNYKISQIGALMQRLEHKYFATDTAFSGNADTLSEWKMNLDLALLKSPLWHQLLPSLNHFGGAHIKGMISSRPDSVQLDAVVSPFTYNDIAVESVRAVIRPEDNKLNYALAAKAIKSSSLNIPYLYLKGKADSNALSVNLKTMDEERKERYHLLGKLNTQNNENYKFSLVGDSLLLNYEKWTIPSDNYILYNPEKLTVHQLNLQNGNQVLSVNSDSLASGNPLNVVFKNFKITTITQLLLKDSLAINGFINGKATIDSVMAAPLFVSDLELDSLSFNKLPVGKISLDVNNRQKNAYDVDLRLSGNGNDVNISGKYYTSEEGRFDFDVALNALPMSTIEAFSFGQIEKASGKLTGNLKVKGTTEAPQINGAIHFDNADFKVVQLNNEFKLKDENITFNSSGIHFNQFTFLDSANNKAVIDGDILTEKYDHFKFNLTLNAHNYRILNARPAKDKSYYGQIYITTDTRITGDESLPKINMNIRLDNKSNFTFVMLDQNPEEVSANGVVEFINPDIKPDSAQVVSSDSAQYSAMLEGIDLSANIAIDTNALLHLVIDPVTGDELKVRGKANLNFGIAPGGKMSLTGRYDIINGVYTLSFESVIKREFDILRGSNIVWEGDPLKATMNITARYDVKAPALDLVQDQLTDISDTKRNTYRQKLPFEVLLHLDGELMQPEIHFDLDMPEESRNAFDGAVYTRINQINTEPSEVNKQTLGLLVLGHFIADNPLQTSGGGGARSLVRQSAGKILSDQLNRLAGDLITGADLSFDLESSEDYSSGTAENRTNLNVGLSKSLFNDRTTVYVGGNIPLEGNNEQKASQIVGDVAVEYKLSKDGRYRLRAYRKNKYEGVIEGEFIETGVSFIITMDYDKFKELFERAKKRTN